MKQVFIVYVLLPKLEIKTAYILSRMKIKYVCNNVRGNPISKKNFAYFFNAKSKLREICLLSTGVLFISVQQRITYNVIYVTFNISRANLNKI